MKIKRFLNISLIFIALLALWSISASTSELEKHPDLGYIYWYGGEDVSYDDGGEDLVSVEDYDTIDMFVTMSMKDIEANIGISEEYLNIAREIPDPVVKKDLSVKKPMIAIIIDDMGVNQKMSKEVLDKVKQPITLSFLPYARNLQHQVNEAKEKGHEITLHLPWEPYSMSANPGPNALLTEDTKEALQANLVKNLNSFTGYEGVNNHMGSKFSRYRAGIDVVMEEVKKRNLFFVDSMTDAKSIAEKVAAEYSIPTTHRNVFLDHIATDKFVNHALKEVERIALKEGSAVAIGHPKAATVKGLAKWLPTLEAKGFEVVTIKQIINKRRKVLNVDASKGNIIRN